VSSGGILPAPDHLGRAHRGIQKKDI